MIGKIIKFAILATIILYLYMTPHPLFFIGSYTEYKTLTLIITFTLINNTSSKIFLTALTIAIITYTILIAQTITYYYARQNHKRTNNNNKSNKNSTKKQNHKHKNTTKPNTTNPTHRNNNNKNNKQYARTQKHQKPTTNTRNTKQIKTLFLHKNLFIKG
jgi:ABC-type nickel/cobalt efflux system permease component RcnA